MSNGKTTLESSEILKYVMDTDDGKHRSMLQTLFLITIKLSSNATGETYLANYSGNQRRWNPIDWFNHPKKTFGETL